MNKKNAMALADQEAALREVVHFLLQGLAFLVLITVICSFGFVTGLEVSLALFFTCLEANQVLGLLWNLDLFYSPVWSESGFIQIFLQLQKGVRIYIFG